jgi:L-ribulose-5-phosphate 3-epimerase
LSLSPCSAFPIIYREIDMNDCRRPISRRSMLARSAGAAALAALSSFSPLLAAPRSRWFKIGSCDWSLGKRGDPAALDVAKQIGLDGVQIIMGDPGNDMQLRRPEVQKAYLDASRRTGVKIPSLAIDAMHQAPLQSDPRAAAWISDGIDICKKLDMPVCMIVGFDLDPTNKTQVDRFVEAAKGVVPKAEQCGVMIGMENWLSAADHLRIIERVGSPALKVYYDVGNSTDKGRDVAKEIRMLGKHICELHAKDAGHMLGQGRIDFRQVRRALDDVEYSGWLQIEAAAPHGLAVDYAADYKYLKDIFPNEVKEPSR